MVRVLQVSVVLRGVELTLFLTAADRVCPQCASTHECLAVLEAARCYRIPITLSHLEELSEVDFVAAAVWSQSVLGILLTAN